MEDGAQGEDAPRAGPGRVGSCRAPRPSLGPPHAVGTGQRSRGAAHGERSRAALLSPARAPGRRSPRLSPLRAPLPQFALSPRRLGPPRGVSAAPGSRDGTPAPPRRAPSRRDSPRACGSMAARGLSRACGTEPAPARLGRR